MEKPDWIEFYKELSLKLLEYKNNRKELIAILNELESNKLFTIDYILKDDEIDPFTFFSNFNRQLKDENRIAILNYLKNRFNLKSKVPNSFVGIPTVNNQNAGFVHHRDDRNINDINNLWLLFENVLTNKDIEDVFNKVIKIKYTNKKITQGLFWIAPDKYLSLDNTFKNYINKNASIIDKKKFNSAEFDYNLYNTILEKVKQAYPEKSFLDLSIEAYENKKDKPEKIFADNVVLKNDLLLSNTEDSRRITEIIPILESKKQIILYGPPGTAKTWITKEIVKSMCKQSYDELKAEQRIKFVTFHQSYAYEEFVEGIKPQLSDEFNKNEGLDISYNIANGSFKEICKNAIADAIPNTVNEKLDFKKNFFKMSLGNTLKKEQNIYQYCIDNDCIALGWGGDINYLNVKSKDEIKEKFEQKHGKMDYPNGLYSEENSPFHITAINFFILNMKIGDYVLISEGNKRLKAIGVITGDYIYNADVDISYHQFRPVHWLAKNLNLPVEKVLRKKFSQQSIYELFNADLIQEELAKLIANPISNIDSDQLNKIYDKTQEERKIIFKNSKTKPFFLIIDEINRGNISKILGELITLLENNKRLGEDEELTVELPYSKEQFGVPPNLYIIATMNTADRSIANLDIALRRRFGFYEMTPNYDFIDVSSKIKEIKLSELLKKINKKIEIILDKDHTIGAAYFAKIQDLNGLKMVWDFEIIPLLQEYFYNDWEKLEFVIGKEFIDEDKIYNLSAKEKDLIDEDKKIYKLHKFNDNNQFLKALQNIINDAANIDNN